MHGCPFALHVTWGYKHAPRIKTVSGGISDGGTADAADAEAGQRMVEYAEDLVHHALHVASQKPSGRLLALQPCMAPSVAEALARPTVDGEELGRWMRTAMCLLPLQLSRYAWHGMPCIF